MIRNKMAEKRTEYGFVRLLLKDVPEEQRKAAFQTFAEGHLELYRASGEKADAFVPMLNAEECTDGKFCVSAADWEYAKCLAEQKGFSKWLCSHKEAVITADPVADAEREYYKKHRIKMAECAAVVVLGILYLLLRNIK